MVLTNDKAWEPGINKVKVEMEGEEDEGEEDESGNKSKWNRPN